MKHTLWLIAILAAPLQAQRNASIPDPDPELERKTFTVADGFEVSLWAADPLLAKPIQMNWDPQGRLWIASSEVYPQILPGQAANDKILILEDTKNAGKADKVTVFADGLLIPTGLLPGDGGCYVANSTEILHLSASKPGGKADRRRVVLSGFGTEDTHHLIHTFRWGPDGAMYFNQSVYIHSHVETPHGTVRLNGGGIWRYEPRTQKLEVFARGFWNPWGLAFDKYGTLFATDGANGEGIVHVVPGASYPTGGNQAPRVLHGLNPGSPKFCGLEIVSGRHFPDDWQGDLITNDFRGHRVCHFKLRDDGSTFESREMTEVIKSSHPAFRPIDVSIGPDGALYIADWYNPIIQHGEVDFRDPRRDKTHGRIWRVTAKGRKLVEKPNFKAMKIMDVMDRLKSPDAWTRLMARQIIREKHESPEPKTIYESDFNKWMKQISNDDEQTILEAMWVDRTFRPGSYLHFDELIKSKNPSYRMAYLRGLSANNPMLNQFFNVSPIGVTSVLPHMVNDPSPRVRLEAIRAAAKLPNSGGEPFKSVLDTLNHPMDPTLEYALWLTMRELQDQWVPEFKKGTFNTVIDMKKLAFALEAVQSPETIPPLIAMLKANKVPNENVNTTWALVARLGDETELTNTLLFAMEKNVNDELREAILTGLEYSIRTRGVKPKLNVGTMSYELLRKWDSEKTYPRIIRLVGLWKTEALRPDLEMTAKGIGLHGGSKDDSRAALESLALIGGDKSVRFLNDFANGMTMFHMNGKSSPPVTEFSLMRHALRELITLNPEKAAPIAAAQISKYPEATAELITPFLQRKNGAALLAKSIEEIKLNADAAKLASRIVRNAGNPSPALLAAISKAGGLDTTKKEATPQEINYLAVHAKDSGEAARGELIFRRKELQCLACHAIAGAGGAVGPDLTSIGASAQVDYLVESLLLPNKAIKEGYHTVDVTTTSGKIVSGIKVREGNGELVLRDKDDKEITLRLDDIDTRRTGRSLMPDGAADSLTRAELLDLVKFLSELGKVGPYAPSTAKLVRRWEVIEPTKENLDKFRRERIGLAAEKPGEFAWNPVIAQVNGDLPLAEVPQFTVWKESGQQSVVRFKFTVSTAGTLVLKANAPATAYLDQQATAVDKPIEVKSGEHTITLILDRAKAASGLRMEVDGASTARVTLMNNR